MRSMRGTVDNNDERNIAGGIYIISRFMVYFNPSYFMDLKRTSQISEPDIHRSEVGLSRWSRNCKVTGYHTRRLLQPLSNTSDDMGRATILLGQY
ncbi:hypothetical protein NPIL_679741 [Nephila pilipes]|uniref:Uncharacterized protein n=1 Tax=Nephila pilipes TaxID=299642 RepID=A0A8X6MSL2_NEPPI|nr:hypothetical protein NPIL_679741 [Nephila pilipes]